MRNFISSLGSYTIFAYECIRESKFLLRNGRLLIKQMEFIGNKSFSIIVLSSLVIGAVFGIQFGAIFRIFGAESMIGAAASFALSKELAPVVSSFLVAGRAGSAMAAEIASMKVGEQLDAMRVMSVNPVGYLASPRIIAAILMMPLIAGFFTLCGVISCYFMGVYIFAVDEGLFLENIRWITKVEHVVDGLEKAAVFGGILAFLSCYQGFRVEGGAKGVGKATTKAVVSSLVMILLIDVMITYIQFKAS